MVDGNVSLSSTSSRKNLINELKDPTYRNAFIEAHATDTVAFQIRRMREAKGWTQGQLAVEAFGDVKLQSMVSRLENPDYGKYSVSTLVNLAKVFDVGLVVRFAPFSEVVDWDLNKSGPTFQPPPFAEDIALAETRQPATAPSVQKASVVNFVFVMESVGGSNSFETVQIANPSLKEKGTSWQKKNSMNYLYPRQNASQSR